MRMGMGIGNGSGTACYHCKHSGKLSSGSWNRNQNYNWMLRAMGVKID